MEREQTFNWFNIVTLKSLKTEWDLSILSNMNNEFFNYFHISLSRKAAQSEKHLIILNKGMSEIINFT